MGAQKEFIRILEFQKNGKKYNDSWKHSEMLPEFIRNLIYKKQRQLTKYCRDPIYDPLCTF